MNDGPLTKHQTEAEEIRAHLVSLRGGAPFLSPTDGMLLQDWLDRGVSVASILAALERCADSRRKKGSRLPLTLSAAKRHLGKPGVPVQRVVEERRPAVHPLEPVASRVAALGGGPAERCAAALRAVSASDRDRALRDALAAVRDFVHARWDGLGPDERERRLRSYMDLLELDPDEPEGAGYATALGMARDGLRRDWPWLNAATLSELLT